MGDGGGRIGEDRGEVNERGKKKRSMRSLPLENEMSTMNSLENKSKIQI